MKKILLAVVLGVAVVAGAQQAAQPAQQPAAQSQPSQQPAQPAQGQPATQSQSGQQPAQGQAAAAQAPVIKDPAEYNAYVNAIQQTDPNAQISGLEAFLTQYPNSIMKNQALEILMSAYQKTSNVKKTMETATKLVTADACNERGLALLAYFDRVLAQGGDPNAAQLLADGKKYGQQGLDCLPKWNKPEGTSDADFQKMKDQMTGIFNAAIGVKCLQDKDYACAIKALRIAVDGNPGDFSVVYPLALAYLSQVSMANVAAKMSESAATFTAGSDYPKGFDAGNKIVATGCSASAYNTTWTIQSGGSGSTTLTAGASAVSGLSAATGCTITVIIANMPDYQNGIWFAARAAAVAPPAAQAQIEKYAHGQYLKYRQDEEGWPELLAAAKAGAAQVPIKPPLTPADQAHKFVLATPPEKMDFAQWEFVLSNGSSEDQATVWNAIKSKPVQMNGTVIEATADQFLIAGSLDDIEAKKADITLTFEDKIPAKLIPKAGASLDFQGNPASYTQSPFMMTMEKGMLPKPKAAPPAHKPPVHHKPS